MIVPAALHPFVFRSSTTGARHMRPSTHHILSQINRLGGDLSLPRGLSLSIFTGRDFTAQQGPDWTFRLRWQSAADQVVHFTEHSTSFEEGLQKIWGRLVTLVGEEELGLISPEPEPHSRFCDNPRTPF